MACGGGVAGFFALWLIGGDAAESIAAQPIDPQCLLRLL